MRNFFYLSAVIMTSTLAQATPVKPTICLSTREYITTLEFLRDHKDFAVTETQARAIADKVSSGCSNASKRFINVTEILVKAGMPTNKAIETGLKFALNDDEATEAFMTVFTGAFNEKLLDLDMGVSLETALTLSESFKGNRKSAVKDFNKLVDFCVSKKHLDLPLIQCASVSTRILKAGEEFDYKVGESFIDLFSYLTKQQTTNLPTFQAMEISEYVVKFGPEARGNFVRSYEYAVNKKGLDLSTQEAINFGKLMASRSAKAPQN